ncbi:MAG: hypothetical protein OHK0056_15540 [Bacteriovoracaceae bacterium]
MERVETLNKKSNEKGQLTIFLGLSMVLIMTFLAFIINVGLFVKAKINLQNAVDAAAYAGASVQARQLTNISYLNWEIRNTYKEWVFKQYVLGQKGLSASFAQQFAASPSTMNFRLKTFYNPSDGSYFDNNVFDRYNLPSICIHFGSPHNICGIASVPGLPRFETLGISGISEENESFLNAIVKTKANDCSTRSNLNFGTAMLWAFGDGKGTLFPDIPEIASQRPGAWPQALELGVRMRNLEAIVNAPPVPEVCQDGAQCSTNLSSLINSYPAAPMAERTTKALMSAIRNLGGKANSEGCEGGPGSNMACSFTLSELAPQESNIDINTLSGLLLPSNSGGSFRKMYLDLIAYPVNFVTFFSMFNSSTGNFKNSGTNSEAECGIIKTAIPVPGYIMGFTKNPKIMTYYAVKGKAKFVGMLYPFKDRNGIELTAYAAAKPFGGRIGPRLFVHDPDSTASKQIKARSQPNYLTTSSYIMGLDTNGITGFNAGNPIPSNQDFWILDPSGIIGGTPASGVTPKFAVPNLLYDFSDPAELASEKNKSPQIQILNRALTWDSAYSTIIPGEDRGLYNQTQFKQFWNLQNSSGAAVMSAEDVEKTLQRVRAPTRYEALNYMIPNFIEPGTPPNPFDTNPSFIDQNPDPEVITYMIYAPLYGQGLPHNLEVDGIIAEVTNIIQFNMSAIDRFLEVLKEVADSMIAASSSLTTSPEAYVEAAKTIYREPLLPTGAPTDPECQNLSLAQQFAIFFKSGGEQCGITSIEDYMRNYFERMKSQPGHPNYYSATFRRLRDGETAPFDPQKLMTGYSPGTRQGATENGEIVNISGNPTGLARRNYYSTKFIQVNEYLMNSANGSGPLTMSMLHENGDGSNVSDVPAEIINKLDPSVLSEYSKIDF